MADWLEERGVELVVLAGYMAMLDAAFLARFAGRAGQRPPVAAARVPGLGAIEQALGYGVKVFGVTVHFVDAGVDTGPVIFQRAIELPARRPEACTRRCARSSTRCCRGGALLARAVRRPGTRGAMLG